MTARKTIEEFIDQATYLHNSRYAYLNSEYISSHTKILITCNIHSDFLQTPHNHLKGQGCPPCMAVEKFDNLRFTNEEVDEYFLKNKSTIKKIDNYINSSTNMELECLKCNNRWHSSLNHIKRSGGCPKCNDTRLSNEHIDDFINRNYLQLKRIGQYVNTYTKISWQCLKCDHIWLAQPCEITRVGETREGSGCPECARGKNEKRVAEVLQKLNIKFDKSRIDLPTGQKLFPDFYLSKYNTIIEYNGIQHYQPTCFGSMSKLDADIKFEFQKIRDKLLMEYCKERQIFLLEIDGRKYKGEKLKKFVFDYFKSGDNYV